MTAQPSLFDNRAHMDRVRSRIEGAILCYVRKHTLFHAVELQAFVNAQAGPIAPDSSARILRSMKQRGLVAYTVVNRRASLYQVTQVCEEAA